MNLSLVLILSGFLFKVQKSISVCKIWQISALVLHINTLKKKSLRDKVKRISDVRGTETIQKSGRCLVYVKILFVCCQSVSHNPLSPFIDPPAFPLSSSFFFSSLTCLISSHSLVSPSARASPHLLNSCPTSTHQGYCVAIPHTGRHGIM